MELVRDCFSLQRTFAGAVLTIGNFDGLHVGHQRIVSTVVEAARTAGAKAVVFTFEPHPDAILHPDHGPERIMAFDRKMELLAETGIDAVVCPDGPLGVLALTADDFVRQIIAAGIGAGRVVEGPDFAFGRRAAGNDELLRRMGRELGFELQIVPRVAVDGVEVSSTRIRELLRQGAVGRANVMLGRPFEFVGQVVHGRHRGHTLGFPTVNLSGGDFLVPADGVYAGRATLDGAPPELRRGPFAAAISVGRAPTFGELPRPEVEAFLLDFEGDLYGRVVRLEFVDRLREQRTFAGPEALVEQMRADCQVVRRVLAGRG
jgi:riboflavin kinase / FMN adenylyltransferase